MAVAAGHAQDADPAQRVALLKEWDKAPSAGICHPEEYHLIPLMTAIGAAEDEKAARICHESNV